MGPYVSGFDAFSGLPFFILIAVFAAALWGWSSEWDDEWDESVKDSLNDHEERIERLEKYAVVSDDDLGLKNKNGNV